MASLPIYEIESRILRYPEFNVAINTTKTASKAPCNNIVTAPPTLSISYPEADALKPESANVIMFTDITRPYNARSALSMINV